MACMENEAHFTLFVILLNIFLEYFINLGIFTDFSHQFSLFCITYQSGC